MVTIAAAVVNAAAIKSQILVSCVFILVIVLIGLLLLLQVRVMAGAGM